LVPDHIKLEADDQNVPADGTTTIIRAIVYDESGKIVTNYNGTITFASSSELAVFSEYNFNNGIATTKLSSTSSGTAIVTVSSSDGLPCEPEGGIEIVFETTLTLVEETTYYEGSENKVITFDVRVTGENIVVDAMKIIWTDNHPNEKFTEIKIEDEIVYDKQNQSGITVDIKTNTISSGEDTTIKITFNENMSTHFPIDVYFNSGTSQYEIELSELPVSP